MDAVRDNDVAAHDLGDVLGEKVTAEGYPCLGARSVFQRGRATVRVYDTLAGPQTAALLLADLTTFADDVDPAAGFASFVATFRGPEITGEEHFERLLWAQLQAVADVDGTPLEQGGLREPPRRPLRLQRGRDRLLHRGPASPGFEACASGRRTCPGVQPP